MYIAYLVSHCDKSFWSKTCRQGSQCLQTKALEQGYQVQVKEKCQTTCEKIPNRLKNAKQAETGRMLSVLILPESKGRNTVVLVNTTLINIAYKATNNYCTVKYTQNRGESKPERPGTPFR